MKPKVLFVQGEQNVQTKNQDLLQMYIYGLIATVSLTAAIFSVWHFKPEDKITTSHGVLLFVSGGFYFTALYYFSQLLITRTEFGVRHLVKKYKFHQADVWDISNKIVSATQALFCCITGYVIWQHSCCKDVVHANHFISHAYAWFGAAYFLYDIWSMYKVHVCTPPGQINTPSTQMATPAALQHGDVHLDSSVGRFCRYVRLNPIIVGHHLFIGIFGFLVIIYLRGNLGDCVFGFVFLMEASTPFVSLRSVLSRFHMKNSKLYIYNGFAMLVVFFLCRVAMFPYVLYLYARSTNLTFAEAVYSLPRGCKISMSILMFPQLYWFYLMMRGATKIMTQSSTPKKTPPPEMGTIGGNLIMDDKEDAQPEAAGEDSVGEPLDVKKDA